VLNDGPFDGYDAAVSFELVAHASGLDVVANQEYDPRATDYTSLALSVAQSGANCVLVSALPGDHAVPLVERLVATMPRVLVFAIGALAQPSFTSPEAGGLPIAVDPHVIVTAPGADEGRPDGIVLPSSYAAYGYESMRLLLGAISQATAGGRDPARRSHVLSALFGAAAAGGPLGRFTVRSDGSTTLTRCAIYRLRGGRMALWYDDVAGAA
jgi:branched-chain amino acid transport system substrate-binding protein